MVLYDPAQQRSRLHDLMCDLAGRRVAVAVFGAPADFTARLAAARRRHAGHYRDVLKVATDLYLKGGDQVLCGLALFDRERRNIESGPAGVAADDPAAAPRSALNLLQPEMGVIIRGFEGGPRIGSRHDQARL